MNKIKEVKTAGTPSKGKQPLSHGVGRRKKAVARAWLHRGSGKITVNGEEYTKYFDTEFARLDAYSSFRAVPASAGYDVAVNVYGGGLNAQADAVSLAAARALVLLDEAARPLLRKFKLLTCDSRVKERKKYGQKAARRKFQFVKR